MLLPMTNDFDHIAVNYDASFTHTPVGIYQRKLVFEALESQIKDLEIRSVLELNAGTGEDALYFAKNAKEIISTDIAENMVAQINSKIKNLNNADAQTLDINKLNQEKFESKFDLIFSNFGGFNCLTKSEITTFFKDAKAVLNQSSYICLVIMPRFCAWESLYFLSKINPRKAFRRRNRNGVSANVEGKDVKTYYYSTGDISSIAKDFDVIASAPIGFQIPPSYLNAHFANKSEKLARFYKKDRKRLSKPRFSNAADHYFICLKLK
ncbi:MAG: ubiquinone/menaquinone biosynthesis C-methylase UbiE [Parvicella sp.]|jgi:ubiquinone/menaquinone biosynthesis C-methylase UbiE